MATMQPPIPLPSPETRSLFFDALREKGTMLAACRAAGVTRAGVRRWIACDPAFEQDLEDALADFRDSLQDRLLSCIEEDRQSVALRFLLRAEMPEKYGQRPILGIKPWFDDDVVPGPSEPQDVVTQFFHYLHDAVQVGGAHVAPMSSRDASPPSSPVPSRACPPSPSEESEPVPNPGNGVPSLCIGWRDGEDLFLDPVAAGQVVEAFGKATGWPLMGPPAAIGHCLRECGLLLGTEEDSEHLTVRRYIDGVRRRVLHVPAKYVLEPVPPVPSPSPDLLDSPPHGSLVPVPSRASAPGVADRSP